MNWNVQGIPLPAVLQPATRLTGEELYRFCRENADLRVEQSAGGDIMLMSPAGSGSGKSNAGLTALLFLWATKDGRGVSFDSSAGWTLPDGSMLNPDASWVSRPRWNALTREQRRRFAPLCPEFVVELRSPTDSLPVLRSKMDAWLANGAELGWLIDPDARTVEIFRPGRAPELVEGQDVLRADGPVAGFALDLRLVWSEPAEG